ncbi:outer membrane beta-barrel protein [Steroidobacter sp.]|uniref:outer membrane beta-barrel protein n=1 Tax=Steroidobacter sp. TaxID=1978227 RepID=UPI001A5E0EE9|nr:outer membrane beta-barrel protein [Steroidobacter sp.]MBL8267454.1 outer membrane beta-barrel protein [Steroidobacter sp.]
MTAKANTLRRNPLLLAAVGTVLCNAALAAQPNDKKEEHLWLSEQFLYDDNVFRDAESTDTTPDPTAREVFREDYVNRITLGLGNDFHMGQQTLKLRGRAYDVRYQDNDYLDYVGGDASAQFDFRLLAALSGRLGGSYNRTLADFANTLGTDKDLIEMVNYNAMVRYELGPRWSISAGGGRIETEHGLASREIENMETNLGRVSIDYATPSFHSFGVEYRYMEAKFPNAIVAPGASVAESNYEENAALARFTYTATVRTQFRVTAGYVERERPANPEGRYSGDTWRAEIDWKPREKFSTLFSAWSELKAYTDVESDYFVSDGYSIAPSWSPTEKLIFTLTASYEEQEYLNTRDLELVNGQRNDEVLTGLFTFTYKPREQLAFELSYRGSDRDSNRVNRRYDNQVAGIQVRWSVF